MKHILRKLLVVLAIMGAASLASTAHAIALTDPGVVGTVTLNGNNPSADPTTEAGLLNQLLSMGANQTITIPVTTGLIYTTGPVDYNGTVSGANAIKVDGGVLTVPAGYVGYLMAKYDGQNAGYVAYALDGSGMTLSQYPANLFTTNPTQYALSHYTIFPSPSVPEGGNVLALLAFGLLTAEGVRQKLLRR